MLRLRCRSRTCHVSELQIQKNHIDIMEGIHEELQRDYGKTAGA